MRIPFSAALLAALTIAAPLSQAASINSAYTSLGGGNWLLDLTVVNDGTPLSFAGFTVDLPDASNIVLIDSPAQWDTLVIQPDLELPDAGFVDSYVPDPAHYLAPGQSQGGFRISFSFAGTPGATPFVLSDANFEPLYFGTTTVTAVPEPHAALMALLGLAALGIRAQRSKARCASLSEGAAA